MTHLTRRGFAGASAGALLAAHLGLGGAGASTVSAERKLMRNIARDFAKAKRQHSWTQALENVAAPRLETKDAALEGQWPEELQGIFYRTGPALHERNGERYAHWFDGDGMVHRYGIGGGKVSHLGRMAETPKYRIEEEAGRFLLPTFGTMVDSDLPVNQADDINVANINMLPQGDEVLALWEGGSAFALDGSTLESHGFKAWSPETKGLPFSAHHKVDPDGTIWNFGIANGAARVVLWQISSDGQLKNVKVHPFEPNGMVHDFIVTEKHLVLIVPPFLFDEPRPPFVDAFKWHEGEASQVLIFDKNTLDLVRRVEMPGDFHFHFGNAWEDTVGSLTFDYCASPDASFANEGGRALMRGQYNRAADVPTSHMLVQITRNGKVTRETMGEAAEFPRVDPRLVGRRHRFISSMWQPEAADSPFFQGIARVDLTLSRRETYDYGRDVVAEEHIFIPRPGAPDDAEGWVLGTTLNLKSARTSLNLFDAAHLSDGPIARAELGYCIPIGLHGTFRPA